MTIESAAAVYNLLFEELGHKSKTSLKNLKAACDLIVSSRGVMNISSVAKVATEHYGGPKAQSVQNNKHLKRYIVARMHEYNKAERTHTLPSVNNKKTQENSYPVSNLDVRTKLYIDELRTRLNLCETRYQDLRKWQEHFTKANPVDFTSAISAGAIDNDLLKLEYQNDNTALLTQVKQAIKSLLNLENYIPNLQVKTRGKLQKLTLERPGGNVHIVLEPKAMKAIRIFIDEDDE